MKKCVGCKEEKDEAEFAKNAASEDGLQSQCRACQREYRIKRGQTREPGWGRKTADIVAYRKEYREKNRKHLNDLKEAWVQKKAAADPEWAKSRMKAKYERQQKRLHGPDWKPTPRKSAEELTTTKKARNKRKFLERIEKYPEKHAAKLAVRAAVKAGLLKRLPCLVCGEKAEAHHPDYSRPLDVVWLCPAHHQQVHREAREWAKHK